MMLADVVDQYFTHESRVASFQTSTKRRASNASTKASKALKWPHKFLSGEQLAKAGFFYHPLQSSPDNVACFLCHTSLDGWEEGDDPLVEHLKHSPDCGWAVVASIERDDGVLSQEYPCSAGMIEARKATFANKWPHEGKKGWKCKTKQMVDAGWKYTPTPELDDTATCTYCGLSLDGWEPSDKPLDEHFRRSPECPFFTIINDHKQGPVVSKTKLKRGRASKASRLSTQSAFTVASEAPWLGDQAAEDGDSVITTATNATATTQTKMGRKKAAVVKGKKTRSRKNEVVEVEPPAPEPEDDDFSVKVDLKPKANRGRKRKSEQIGDPEPSNTQVIDAPPAKRRTTRTRGSMAVDDSVLTSSRQIEMPEPTSKPMGRKARPSSRSTRKVSTAASVASIRADIPDDDELDRALQADLDTQMTGDEGAAPAVIPPKKPSRSKASPEDHAMFAPKPMDIDDAVIDAEMEALEAEADSKPLPKARGAKAKQTRKVSAKQLAAAKKLAEAETEVEAERLAEEDASQQIAAELEHSLSMQHSSPVVQSKRQRANSRQLSLNPNGRQTRGSALPSNDDEIAMAGEINITVHEDNEDSGHETDASMASQSTVVRSAASRRGSTLKKTRDGKAPSRNIEEIVHKTAESVDDKVSPVEAGQKNNLVEESQKTKTAKPKGRIAKAPATVQERVSIIESLEREPAAQPETKAPKCNAAVQSPRLISPAPREMTPALSPQSSDAENHPPSSKPSLKTKKPSTPQTTTTRIPLAATPMLSPSKRNVIAGLQSTHPWTAVDLDIIFLKSPSDENQMGLFGDAMDKAKHGALTSPEKKMSVDEWIQYNAQVAEQKLRNECERMVGLFECEGTRAMRALEGVECVE